MADLIKKIKIKKQDGTFTDYIPIGAEAQNISTNDGDSVQLKLNKKPYYYNSVADMKADTKLKAGDMAVTLGYYEPNDGGEAEYRIVNGTYTDDGGSYHKMNNNLFAELIIKNNRVNIKQFGVYGDGVYNDSNKISIAVNKANCVFFPMGLYKISSNVVINHDVVLEGEYDKTFFTTGLVEVTNSHNVTFNKMGFKDTVGNAIYSSNGILTFISCKFNNIALNYPNPTAIGAIYVKNAFKLNVEQCSFENIHGFGAIYAYCPDASGVLVATKNYFNLCDYRAFNIIGSSPVSGLIYKNEIIDCGKNNTASSGGVGCNGIYMPNGHGIIVDNNIIIRPRENAIEGLARKITNNYIEDTNCTLDTHPTPSIEGIHITNVGTDFLEVAYNTLIKTRHRAIACLSTGSESNDCELYIHDNYIGPMIDVEGYDKHAIWLQSEMNNGLSNKRVEYNYVKDKVAFLKGNKTNSYIGDIKYLDSQNIFGAGTVVASDAIMQHIHTYFTDMNNLEGWTYSNCTPSIISIENGHGSKAIHIDYQQYAKLLSPKIYFANKLLYKVTLFAKGTLSAQFYTNDQYDGDVLSQKTYDDYTLIETGYRLKTTDVLNSSQIRFYPGTDASFDIAYIKIDYYTID